MTAPVGKMPKLFGALGADESAFDARTKAEANDAKSRWPMFKSLAPQSDEETPVLTQVERSRWSDVAPAPLEDRAPMLSRPGLSSKLFKGLGKIARQTSAEVLGSARRAAPHADEPMQAKWSTPAPQPEPAPLAFAQRTVAPGLGLFAKPAAPVFAQPVPSALRSPLAFQSSTQPQPTDDSLSGLFQRLEGNRPQSTHMRADPAAKAVGVMSRLGKR